MADFEKAKKERELQKAATETSNGAVKVRRWAPPADDAGGASWRTGPGGTALGCAVFRRKTAMPSDKLSVSAG